MESGRRFGYVRLNRLSRNSPPQLQGVAIDHLFTDVIVRKKQLPVEFHAMERQLRAGDTLVVQSIDRIGRGPREFLVIARELTRQGVCIECVSEGLRIPAGEDSLMRNFLLLIMGAFHDAAQSWAGESRSEARRSQLVVRPTAASSKMGH